MQPLHPWQQVTVGSGLMLHAPLTVRADAATLQREFAALDAATGDEGRQFRAGDGSWSSITLIDEGLGSDGLRAIGRPTPALDLMPGARSLLEGLGCRILSCYVHRQEPGGLLRWHYDNAALHWPEARLIVPVLVPSAAVTWIGDSPATYPAGTLWAADFTFPHQVENAPEAQRIVLLVDVVNDDRARSLTPAELYGQPALRATLAERAINSFLANRDMVLS
ncbi:aspartyl/asparaginyl beta-hydroxylase domain-containing protein (plasmid) [Azospirillum sp. TSA2s]|uniref:aspartyl/asparaginyl beta-hydroxylase domain-containing protein n=1 Tax=Azospirillum sp. TSA2s TaxID=709810 RepID=UPI0010AA9440|nr:aspartyl/asparaginyl beta-hydroxylase domain-containing protein [Azospirillum sp. TSA2s]QCG92981.1 aspartyl/asparaginyl beta-hydroxylase domain-containing protein [Azospirillum sp. TSA2s]